MDEERGLLRRVLDGSATAKDMTTIVNRAVPLLAMAVLELWFKIDMRRLFLATLVARQQQLEVSMKQDDDEFLNDSDRANPSLDDRMDREDPCDGGRIPLVHCPVCDARGDADEQPGDDGRPLGDLTAAIVQLAQEIPIGPSLLVRPELRAAIAGAAALKVDVTGRSGRDLQRAAMFAAEILGDLATRDVIEIGMAGIDRIVRRESTQNTFQPAETVHRPTGPWTWQPAESDKSRLLLTLARGVVRGLLRFRAAERRVGTVVSFCDLEREVLDGELDQAEGAVAAGIEKAVADVASVHCGHRLGAEELFDRQAQPIKAGRGGELVSAEDLNVLRAAYIEVTGATPTITDLVRAVQLGAEVQPFAVVDGYCPVCGNLVTEHKLSCETRRAPRRNDVLEVRPVPTDAPFQSPPQDAEGRAVEDEVHRRIFGEDPDQKDRA